MAWDDIPDWALGTAEELLAEVKAKDEFTFYHCCRVGRRSRKLAKFLGLNEFEQSVIEYAGLFHDIGKVRVPTEILVKPGRLDKSEIEVMKSHPEFSADMIRHLVHVPFFRFMVPGIRYHHERIDGAGYPNAISGEAIPLFARVIAVVDSFDAMTHARPYRNPLPEERAVKELKDFSGRQFDAKLVQHFLELMPHLKREDERDEHVGEVVVAHLIKRAA